MYRIEWLPRTLRQLKKIKDRETRLAIFDAVATLKHWPACRNIKALVGRPGYRLRVGGWRIVFDVEQSLRIITIEEVKKRDERTY